MKKNIATILGKKKNKLLQNDLFLNKRQRFVISVILLSLGLFFTEHTFGKSGFYITIVLSVLTSVFFVASMLSDLRGNFSLHMVTLPFLYTFAFGMFYFLTPARFLSRVVLTSLYAVGLYSLFLSLNIFIVASIRTIGLLSSARTVSFLITLISYFFLTIITFTLHLSLVPTALILFSFTYLLVSQSIWTITLEKKFWNNSLFCVLLSLCLFEIGLILWFWPTSPTVLSVFLTGFFYTIVGLSHVWFEKRLFKGVIWEYLWVAFIVFSALIVFTNWNG